MSRPVWYGVIGLLTRCDHIAFDLDTVKLLMTIFVSFPLLVTDSVLNVTFVLVGYRSQRNDRVQRVFWAVEVHQGLAERISSLRQGQLGLDRWTGAPRGPPPVWLQPLAAAYPARRAQVR